VRTLQAEWRQALQGKMIWGAKEDESSNGHIWAADFTILWPVLNWQAFWNLQTVYFFNFQFFFPTAVNHGQLKPPTLNKWIQAAHLYIHIAVYVGLYYTPVHYFLATRNDT
jgi:hypothetical protein